MSEEEAVVVPVPAGPALEGRLGLVYRARGGFVLCHPHPLYGGDMDNPVVIRAAEVAGRPATPRLRFNFRGSRRLERRPTTRVEGEQQDIRAAEATLSARLPTVEPDRGDRIFLRRLDRGPGHAAGDAPLGLIAPPWACSTSMRLGKDRGRAPAGGRARAIPTARSRPSTGSPGRRGAEERIIEGADHFFFGKLYPLGEAIGAWLAGMAPAR